MAIAQGLEVRPQADAVSDLTLTVLAAVAEFERAELPVLIGPGGTR